ncbi:MAG: hypothetical protein ACFFB4_06570 [Promethearchaeota archaeon]
MKSKKLIIFLLISSIFLVPLYYQFHIKYLMNYSDSIRKSLRTSAEIKDSKQWINNPNFTSQDNWYITTDGDQSDIEGAIFSEQSNIKVIGKEQIFNNISGVPKATDWIPTKKPGESILPDLYNINEFGCNASHEYWESPTLNIFGVLGNQTRNRPSVLWRRDIKMPVDMKDYIITSANLVTTFNACANSNVETPNDTLTGTNPTAAEYDHVKFYVQISDLEAKDRYQIASYEPRSLGYGDLPAWQNQPTDGVRHYINDTLMTPVPKTVLVFYLNKILETDHQNFSIFLGIDIDVEDNYGEYDRDTFYYLLIKSCNLTFTYQKRIDIATSISISQDCKRISDISNYSVIVDQALLNFNYKIDKAWNSSLSPNSEIRILINDNKHTETIKLASATTNYQEAKLGGFDVSSLISDDVNVSIQIFIADNFALNENITVSIDDVSLVISYTILIPDQPGVDLTWLIYTLTIAIIGTIMIIIIYQTHFKYPPLVRKLRKLRKKIRKGKKLKKISFNKREDIVKTQLQNKKQNLGLEEYKLKEVVEK